ncbi:penicillin-binding protein, partial [Amycolatopsis rhizosphaerae]
ESVNTVFYRMGAQVGVEAVRQAAWDAGIPRQITPALGVPFDSLQNDDADGKGTGTTELGVTIGQYPVRPLDQAQGYATFASGGKYVPLHLVSRVTGADGNTLYSFSAAPKPAFDSDSGTNAAIARTVTESLTAVATSSGDGLAGGRPVAAKTGTAQLGNTGHNSEAWMVGYTPQAVTAVWFGNKKQPAAIYGNYHNGKGREHGYDVYGREEPGYIWQAYMNAYLHDKPVLPFPSAPVISGVPAPVTTTPDTTTDVSSTSTEPPPTTTETTGTTRSRSSDPSSATTRSTVSSPSRHSPVTG